MATAKPPRIHSSLVGRRIQQAWVTVLRGSLLRGSLIPGAIAVCGTFVSAPAVGQNPAPVQMSMPTMTAPNSTRLQVYDVPSELVGSVGAKLQIQYHQYSDVKITTEPKTGQLMVMAPEQVHRQISTDMQQLMREYKSYSRTNDRGMNIGSTQPHTYDLRNLTWREVENSIRQLSGPTVSVTTEQNGEVAVLRLPNVAGMQDVMQIDRRTNQVSLLGNGPSVTGWLQVVQSLDAGQVEANRTTHVMPLSPAEPRKVKRAIQLVKATMPQDQTAGQNPAQNPAQNQPGDTERVMAMGTPDSINPESGLFGDVQIEFIEELDLVIIRGSKRDVERTLQVIDNIKKQAMDTQPDIDIVQLEHANAESVATLVDQLYEEIYQSRQGPISITALGQPNALLMIGRAEVITSVKELVEKLDVDLKPQDQLKVVRLLHASAVDAEETIRSFFVNTPGTGTDARTNLGTKIKVLADFRTNSLILQGSPRELAEAEKLIAEIDVQGTQATVEVRVIPLRNSLAADLQTVLQTVIDGSAEGGNADNSQATPPSGKLKIYGDEEIESGILAGVVVTADPNVNSLVVRAPSQSMDLIEELIRQLDQLPSAEARIKVFHMKNGDATSLAGLIQGLFGLPVTAGQSTNGGFLGLNAGAQTAGLTTGGESSLVQLRISVDTRTNTIIASGSKSDLEVIEVLLLRLDEEGVESRRMEVVWLRNTNAQDVATALQNMLQQQTQQTINTLLQGGLISAFEQVDRQVFIVAEQLTNSLIVSATPRYFDKIIKLVEQLDRRPPLVAIEVMIAQVTLGDTLELGSELGLQDSLLFDRGISSSGTLSSTGFNIGNPQVGGSLANLNALGGVDQRAKVAGQGLSAFGLGRSNTSLGYGGMVLSAASESVNILVRALRDANRLQVLSRPQITTMDNRLATVLVGQKVPIVSGVNQSAVGQSTATTYTDVGLKLTVIPRVNQDGLIVMPLYAQNSSLGSIDSGVPVGFGANGDVIRAPIINSTEAQTTVSAYSGQTVVFAGLITKNKGSVRRGIPFLSDIPILGAAFRFDAETETRTELLIILTPRIIATDEDYEVLKQVESSRMSWCLADVLNIHGDVGLSGGNGLWGPARGAVMYPDLQPSVITDNTLPGESILSAPSEGSYQPQVLESAPVGQPIDPPTLGDPSAAVNRGVLRQASFQAPVTNGATQPAAMPRMNTGTATIPNAQTVQPRVQQGAYR